MGTLCTLCSFLLQSGRCSEGITCANHSDNARMRVRPCARPPPVSLGPWRVPRACLLLADQPGGSRAPGQQVRGMKGREP